MTKSNNKKEHTNQETSPDTPLRLSKLMATRGICSRREADDYISRGMVMVNGIVIDQLGTKVSPDSRITLDSRALRQQKELVTIIVNKPIGYVSAQPEKDYIPAVRLITPENQYLPNDNQKNLQPYHFDGLAVVGRLDIDSQGLLLFTQDGRLAKKIIGEDAGIEKEYIVRVRGTLSHSDLNLLRHGLSLDGKELKPAKVDWINADQLRFVLTEGKKRQIRRMCEMVKLEILGLKRVRIGSLVLGKLPEGQWRFLSQNDFI